MTEPNESKKPKRSNRINSYARFTGIAFQMIAVILIGTYAGIKLDEYYPNDYSIYTVICSLVAVGISMYYVVKQVTDFSKKQDKDHEK